MFSNLVVSIKANGLFCIFLHEKTLLTVYNNVSLH